MMTPRCRKTLALDGRVERSGHPALFTPLCGRPEGHPGPHRSEAAVARYRDADLQRWRTREYDRRQARRDAERRAA